VGYQATVASRLGLLRMKRAASSYGQGLTLLEQLELTRLEAELEDQRRGRSADDLARRHPSDFACDPASAILCEA